MKLTPGKMFKCKAGFIFDGDTLKLRLSDSTDAQEIICRLQWIDTPEVKKPGQSSDRPEIINHWEWAETSKQALANLVNGKDLIAIPLELDRYKRQVCDLYAGSTVMANNVQVNLCKLGLAVSSLPFQKFSFTNREQTLLKNVVKETSLAYKNNIGVWSEQTFILPYDFKRII